MSKRQRIFISLVQKELAAERRSLAKYVRADALLSRDGDVLLDHCRHALEMPGQEKGTLGRLFAKAQKNFQDPAKLRRVTDLIDTETWTVRGFAGEKRPRHQERDGPLPHHQQQAAEL